MLVIPAIDLMDGKCVRLEKGDYARKTEYSDDPAGCAEKFAEAGATLIHVVDLDGARAGSPRNLGVAARIKRLTGLRIEFGGGLRDLESVREAFQAGMDSVILGTAAHADPAFLAGAVGAFGGQVLVAVDDRAGQVAVKGWSATVELRCEDAIRNVAAARVKGVVYTDTARDGTLGGVDAGRLAGIVALSGECGLFLHFAGGVRDIADINRLKDLDADADAQVLRGVIAGKAIYEGTLDLAQAIRQARGARKRAS